MIKLIKLLIYNYNFQKQMNALSVKALKKPEEEGGGGGGGGANSQGTVKL